jgi:uncharacterized protein (DUF934 family)
MPRRLLRNGLIVEDEWRYVAEDAGAGVSPLIMSFEQWRTERERFDAPAGRRLGVVLAAADKVEQLIPDLSRFALVGASFAGPSEGRGYTQGRLLRERWKFAGELRATGYVHRDQLFFLARCGFNSFELPDSELEFGLKALSTFSAAYQPANDSGLPLTLRRHLPDTPASA